MLNQYLLRLLKIRPPGHKGDVVAMDVPLNLPKQPKKCLLSSPTHLHLLRHREEPTADEAGAEDEDGAGERLQLVNLVIHPVLVATSIRRRQYPTQKKTRSSIRVQLQVCYTIFFL